MFSVLDNKEYKDVFQIGRILDEKYAFKEQEIVGKIQSLLGQVKDYYLYKTRPCKQLNCINKEVCKDYHDAHDKRRSPIETSYKENMCISVKKSTPCFSGDACRYCHNEFELNFHAKVFLTNHCSALKSALTCSKPNCAKAHSG